VLLLLGSYTGSRKLIRTIESHAIPAPVEFTLNIVATGEPPSHPSRSAAFRARRSELFFRLPTKIFVLLNCSKSPRRYRAVSGSAQFTKRRSRTLFTSPNIKNVDNVFEPPALISGSGMPTTGILPTTIPTFTNK